MKAMMALVADLKGANVPISFWSSVRLHLEAGSLTLNNANDPQ